MFNSYSAEKLPQCHHNLIAVLSTIHRSKVRFRGLFVLLFSQRNRTSIWLLTAHWGLDRNYFEMESGNEIRFRRFECREKRSIIFDYNRDAEETVELFDRFLSIVHQSPVISICYAYLKTSP